MNCVEIIAFAKQRLQGKHFTILPCPHRDAVGDGMPAQLIHRVSSLLGFPVV